MTASPPPVDLDQIEEALAAATPGEWYTGPSVIGLAVYSDAESRPGIGQTYMPADATAIVAAVNAVPALIARVRAQDAELETLRATVAAVEQLVVQAERWRDESSARFFDGSKPPGSVGVAVLRTALGRS